VILPGWRGLAMFGYRPAMEVNFFIKILLYLGYLLEQPEEKHGDVIDFFPIVGKVFEKGEYSNLFSFFEKGNFQQNICFGQMATINHQKKKKNKKH
jgi:hypothetical protein